MNDKCVLIADDDSPIRGLVRTVLMRRGFVVDQVGSGRDAIECIRHKHYDAIVLDLMMPDGNGDEVLRVLASEIPDEKSVVIMSAASTARIEGIASGNVAAKLRKPFDIDELIAAVEIALTH